MCTAAVEIGSKNGSTFIIMAWNTLKATKSGNGGTHTTTPRKTPHKSKPPTPLSPSSPLFFPTHSPEVFGAKVARKPHVRFVRDCNRFFFAFKGHDWHQRAESLFSEALHR